MVRLIITSIFCLMTIVGYVQDFDSSNLPILIIETGGQEIVDEPKIDAILKIIYQADGSVNRVDSDTFHFNGKIGIELRGQSSQRFPKKGYGLETRDEFGEDKDVSLLDMPEESDWVIHSPYSDKSLIRNALSYHFGTQIMDYAPRTKLCEMILNGEYLGVVLFTEKIKRDKNRVDINKLKEDEISGDDVTGGYILKFDKGSEDEVGWISPFEPIPGRTRETRFLYHYPKPKDIVPEQATYIRSFITDFENALFSDNFRDQELGYRKYIDPSTFIDHMIINEMTKNIDAYRLSTYMYKDKDSEGGLLKMGPVWDYNLAFGNVDYCDGASTDGWSWNFNDICPSHSWVNHFWWKRLLDDPDFHLQLVERWVSLRQGIFSNENLLAVIDSMTTLLIDAQQRNFQKWDILSEWIWPNFYLGMSYENEITYLKNWLIDHVEWMDSHLNLITSVQEDLTSASESMKVYPNPSKGEVTFQLVSAEMPKSYIEIFDTFGRRVYKSSYLSPFEHFTWRTQAPPGFYYYLLRSPKTILQSGRLQVIGHN